ncbi:MAG: aldehyde dehydrogenase family protein [Desulfobacteraceae bacterium]|nr:aldehyde dehydrogenase family protein [Desulfobacteraceae bacterium]
MKNYEFFIGGKRCKSDVLRPVIFPYNGDVTAQVYEAGDADIENAITSAVKGFEITRRLTAKARADILFKLAQEMDRRSEELATALVLEAGKTISVARGEVARAKETIRLSAQEAGRINGEIIPIDNAEGGDGRMGYIRHMPLGPILAISPFNYPLNLSCHKIGPAIAAGNSFILKPASATPLSALLLAEMLLDADYPEQALNVIILPGSKAEKIVSDPRISYLTFTGSCEVGWHLKALSGRKRIGLELGGNAAVIVHEDAHIDYAVSRIIMGGFTNAGQNCISVQRVLVHHRVYDEMAHKLTQSIGRLKLGDPREPDVDIGPMIDAKSAALAFEKVTQATRQGAKILIGGNCSGTLFKPAMLADTTMDMLVNRDELFAPVITIAPYETFDQAVELANDTNFGLQAGVFTQNMNRIFKAYEKLEVGGVQINDVSTFRVDHMPYGGVKDSGIGREGPRYAIEEMMEKKLMVINLAGGKE